MSVTGLSCVLQRRPAMADTETRGVIFIYLSFSATSWTYLVSLSCHTLSLVHPFLCIASSLMTLHFCANFLKIKDRKTVLAVFDKQWETVWHFLKTSMKDSLVVFQCERRAPADELCSVQASSLLCGRERNLLISAFTASTDIRTC